MSDSRSRSTAEKTAHQRGLADPRGAVQEHRLRAAKHRHLEGAVQHRNLRLTADERRALGAGRGVLARGVRGWPDLLEGAEDLGVRTAATWDPVRAACRTVR